MAHTTTLPAEPHSTLSPNTSKLLAQYVHQMRRGCGSFDCYELFCATGAANRAGPHKPVRIFTMRSARASALFLASSLHPTDHLCKFSSFDVDSTEVVDEIDRRDPSSLTQLLVDTPPINNLFLGRQSTNSTSHPFDHLVKAHKQIDMLLTGPLLGKPTCSNKYAARAISSAISALLRDFPAVSGSGSILDMNGMIPSIDRRSPGIDTDDNHSAHLVFRPQPWARLITDQNLESNVHIPLKVQEYFDHGPHQNLCEAILFAIARRTNLEYTIARDRLEADLEPSHRYSNRQLLPLLVRYLGFTPRQDFDARITLDMTSYPLVIWLKKMILRRWWEDSIVKRASPMSAALELMEAIATTCNYDLSFDSGIFSYDFQDSASSWSTYNEQDCSWGRHLLSFKHVTAAIDRMATFRMVNHIKMRDTQTASRSVNLARQRVAPGSYYDSPSAPLRYAEEHYLLLSVSRDSVLTDAFSQLWQRRQAELFRPLRVRLGEVEAREVGQDLGGVQIEFFNLICRAAFVEDYQMFTTNAESGVAYFRAMSLQPLYTFELFGLLVGLATFSAITLPVALPNIFYEHLLAGSNGLDRCESTTHSLSTALNRIKDGWPVLYNSLKRMSAEDDIEYDFTFPLQANGFRMDVAVKTELSAPSEIPTSVGNSTMPRQKLIVYNAVTDNAENSSTHQPNPISLETLEYAWQGWHLEEATDDPEQVTSANKTAYIFSFINFLTHDSIHPQLTAFKRGFFRVIDHHSLSLFHSPQELKIFIEGDAKLDIHVLRAAAQYDGYDRDAEYIQTFWSVVEIWPEEKQRALLKFVTAMERVPVTVANDASSSSTGFRKSGLTFVVKRVEPEDVETLPTSSTCFGILSLPEYASAEILDQKLSTALEYGLEGFGSV